MPKPWNRAPEQKLQVVLSVLRGELSAADTHSRSMVWMNLSALPFVRGRYGRIRRWQTS